MPLNNKVIQFAARPPKRAQKPWVGPIQAERERCVAVLLDPSAAGHWGRAARTLLCETSMSASAIIDTLKNIRAEVRTELESEFAAGRALA